MAFIRAFTVLTAARRAPGRDGCGVQVQTIPPGARQSTVWAVEAMMAAIGALGRQLKRDGIQMVTLESTSD